MATNALTDKELKFCQQRTRSTLRSQRPRLFAQYKAHRKNLTVPTNVNVPVIMGTPSVGHTLESTMGNWNGSPTAYGAQWKRDGVAIPNAVFAKYLVVSADSGHALTCTVTAITGGGQASVTTAPASVP